MKPAHGLTHLTDAAGARPDDANVFPALSDHLQEFPPTVITTCGKDVLRDDGVVFVQMLLDQEVKVKHFHYEGFPHFFHVFYSIPKSREMMQDVVGGIHFVLDSK